MKLKCYENKKISLFENASFDTERRLLPLCGSASVRMELAAREGSVVKRWPTN